jgi:hypothetical protein
MSSLRQGAAPDVGPIPRVTVNPGGLIPGEHYTGSTGNSTGGLKTLSAGLNYDNPQKRLAGQPKEKDTMVRVEDAIRRKL